MLTVFHKMIAGTMALAKNLGTFDETEIKVR